LDKFNKVAEITLLFWVIKIFATTLGETLGDLFSMTINLGYTESLAIILIFFLAVLYSQLKSKKFNPILYWITIVSTTTLGTEVSDFMDRTLGVGYMVGSLILFAGLLLVLFLWHYNLKKINVYPIFELKTEMFYWFAILFSNSLGTAFGDFLSDNLGFGYLEGAMVTSGIIIIVIILHYSTKLNEILLFWIAFIFTRPFGATFGDLLTKPKSHGGLELGTASASLVTALIISALVIYSYKKHKAAEGAAPA
jgi:uncharacterized membrane-anchored protein